MKNSLDYATPFVAKFEGFRSRVYRDAVGVETIGYGETDPHLIDRFRHSGISEPQARGLLRRRLHQFRSGVIEQTTCPLSPRQLAALTSLAYNIGLGSFHDSTVRRELNAAQPARAANAILLWNRAGGHVLAGLSRRRRAERRLFLRGSRPWVRVRAKLLLLHR